MSDYFQVQAIPEDAVNDESEDEDKIDKDERMPQSEKVSLGKLYNCFTQ